MQRPCNLCKAQHKPPVVVAQAQKLLHLFHTRGCSPQFHSIYFALFYTDALGTNHMPQELTTL